MLLYEILGVGKNASPEAIKTAWRKLAKQNHPDTNPGNSEAAARMQVINRAYGILSDPLKRAAYDRGEIDDYGRPKVREQDVPYQQPGSPYQQPSDDVPYERYEADPFQDAPPRPTPPRPPTQAEIDAANRLAEEYRRNRRKTAIIVCVACGVPLAFLFLLLIIDLFALANSGPRGPETKSVHLQGGTHKDIMVDGKLYDFTVFTAAEVQDYPREYMSRSGNVKPIEFLRPTLIEGSIQHISIYYGKFPLLIDGSCSEVDINNLNTVLIRGSITGARTPSALFVDGRAAIGGNIGPGTQVFATEVTYGGTVSDRASVQESDGPRKKHVGPWNGRQAPLVWPDINDHKLYTGRQGHTPIN